MIFKPNSTYINRQSIPDKEEMNQQSIMDIFKTRIFSPIMSGFIISWLVINWEIPYATLFLSAEDIEPVNKIGYINFIINTYDCPQWELMWKPLLYAIGFTILSPLLKYLLDYYIERIKKRYLFEIERIQNNYQLLKDRNKRLEDSSKRIKDEFVSYLIFENSMSFEKFMEGDWRIIFNPSHEEYMSVYYKDKKFYARNEHSKLLFECNYFGYDESHKSVFLGISNRYDNGFAGRYRLRIEDRENLQFNSFTHGGHDIILQRVYYSGHKFSGIDI